MGAEQNKQAVLRFFEAVSNSDMVSVAGLLAPGYLRHDLVSAGPEIEGAEGVASYMASLNAAFPDMRWEIERLVAEGDRVACSYTLAATHLGEFMGIPATGRRISGHAAAILRLADGKIAENWFVADWAGILGQIGALEAVAPPA